MNIDVKAPRSLADDLDDLRVHPDLRSRCNYVLWPLACLLCDRSNPDFGFENPLHELSIT
jgi:hypothetical protein